MAKRRRELCQNESEVNAIPRVKSPFTVVDAPTSSLQALRLLTEILEVRILPGEPKSLSLINYRVWAEHSVHDRMLGHVK